MKMAVDIIMGFELELNIITQADRKGQSSHTFKK